jgi:hypothetical protein
LPIVQSYENKEVYTNNIMHAFTSYSKLQRLLKMEVLKYGIMLLENQISKMGLVEWFSNQKIIPFGRLLSFYPPFFLLGAKVRISEDYRRIRLRLPIRWYIRNNNGVMFGGAISMLSDPFPAIVFEKIFDQVGCMD